MARGARRRHPIVTKPAESGAFSVKRQEARNHNIALFQPLGSHTEPPSLHRCLIGPVPCDVPVSSAPQPHRDRLGEPGHPFPRGETTSSKKRATAPPPGTPPSRAASFCAPFRGLPGVVARCRQMKHLSLEGPCALSYTSSRLAELFGGRAEDGARCGTAGKAAPATLEGETRSTGLTGIWRAEKPRAQQVASR